MLLYWLIIPKYDDDNNNTNNKDYFKTETQLVQN